MKRKCISFLLIIILIAAGVLSGCGSNDDVSPPVEPPVDNGNGNGEDNGNGSEELTDEEIVAAWVENARGVFMAQSRELGGTQYLLVTYGMKESGGYGVEITSVDVQEEKVEITVRFSRPAQGQEVTDAIEYPYALEEIPATGLPAEFIATGAEEYVPHLIGLDFLLPLAAESDGIKLLSPVPGAQVEREFTATGVANVFEGNIEYKLLNDEETVLVSGIGTAAMGDWQYFEIPIVVSDDVQDETRLTLQLYTHSARDGSIQDLVEITLELDLPDAEPAGS